MVVMATMFLLFKTYEFWEPEIQETGKIYFIACTWSASKLSKKNIQYNLVQESY